MSVVLAACILLTSIMQTVIPHPEPAATPTPKPTAKPTPPGKASSTWAARGGATWYDWRSGEAAAGPLLRAHLGAHWRGQIVRVYANGRSILVRLTDWCACGARHGVPTLIDLDRRSFARLADPSRGVLRVEIRP